MWRLTRSAMAWRSTLASTQARKKTPSSKALVLPALTPRRSRDRDESPQTKPEVPEDRFPKITVGHRLGRISGRSINTKTVQGRLTQGRTRPQGVRRRRQGPFAGEERRRELPRAARGGGLRSSGGVLPRGAAQVRRRGRPGSGTPRTATRACRFGCVEINLSA